MVRNNSTPSSQTQALLRWMAGLGAVTADALARHTACTSASARARLAAAERAGLVERHRLLADAPALYTVTRAALRACGARGLQPCRVSVGGAPHAIACAGMAAALEHAYPDHTVMGERELRRDEHDAGTPLASARLRHWTDGTEQLHRPDLVLWPRDRHGLPVAVEVELTVKAPRRLAEICRAWARCRLVAGTIYLVAEDVRQPLARAVDAAHAGERIALVGIEALRGPESTVPVDA